MPYEALIDSFIKKSLSVVLTNPRITIDPFIQELLKKLLNEFVLLRTGNHLLVQAKRTTESETEALKAFETYADSLTLENLIYSGQPIDIALLKDQGRELPSPHTELEHAFRLLKLLVPHPLLPRINALLLITYIFSFNNKQQLDSPYDDLTYRRLYSICTTGHGDDSDLEWSRRFFKGSLPLSILLTGPPPPPSEEKGPPPYQDIHFAVIHKRGVSKILRGGADSNAKAENGITPLHLAAKQGNLISFKILEEMGADRSVLTDDGLHCLHLAAQHGQFEIVEYLLETTSSSLPDRALHTPLFYAVTHIPPKYHEATKQSAKKIQKRQSQINWQHMTIRCLLAAGAQFSDADLACNNLDNHQTVLMVLIIHGVHYAKLAQNILEKDYNNNINVNISDYHGNTALHYAAENFNPVIVKALLLKGADPAAENVHEQIPRKKLGPSPQYSREYDQLVLDHAVRRPASILRQYRAEQTAQTTDSPNTYNGPRPK